MGYINPAWVADEHFDYVSNKDTIDTYIDIVDRDIKSICLKAGVVTSDIPVDVDGYVESVILQSYGIAMIKYKLFSGYWGTRNGGEDIYYIKSERAKEEADRWRGEISKWTILGYTEDETEAPESYQAIKQVPWY